jgi:hypothetical protein
LFEGTGIADKKAAALAAEQRRIGFRQPAGIGNEARRRKMHRAGEVARQMRLAGCDRLGVEDVAGDAILSGTLGIAHRPCKRRFRPKKLGPAGLAQ